MQHVFGLYKRCRPDDTYAMGNRLMRSVRRTLGLLLVAAVAVSMAEPLAPELHDRDSGATVHVDLSSRQHEGDPSDGHSSDAAHLCHCLHAHVGGLPSQSAATRHIGWATWVADLAEDRPATSPHGTLFRPPIS